MTGDAFTYYVILAAAVSLLVGAGVLIGIMIESRRQS